MYRLYTLIIIASILFFTPARAASGDEHWDDQFMTGGLNGAVTAMVTAPDGSIYVGGNFTQAGSVAANHVARWNGTAWSALGAGVNGNVNALALDNGVLYVGGDFTAPGTRIAMWDGSSWTGVAAGPNKVVRALARLNGVLYVGGDFTKIGSVDMKYTAQWDGSAWSALGTIANASTQHLAVAGNTLYGAASAASLSRWTGSAWVRLGLSSGAIYSLVDLGGDLIVAGRFSGTNTLKATVARWNGSTWTKLRSDTLNGKMLYATGATISGGVLYVGTMVYGSQDASSLMGGFIDRLDGTWQRVTGGFNTGPTLLAIEGSIIYAAGGFTAAGTKRSMYFARYDPAQTYSMGTGILTPNPTSIDFGDAPVGSPRGALNDPRNTGTGQAVIKQIFIAGHDSQDFSIDILDHCIKYFRVDWTCEIGITFQPTKIGRRTATLYITYEGDASPMRVPLVGRGQ